MPRGRKKKQPFSDPIDTAVVVPVEANQAIEETPRPAVSAPAYMPPKDPKFTLQDPKIPASEMGSKGALPTAWIAVFKCTNPKEQHKTKATNKTPAKDVPCHKCGWPTVMGDIYKSPPTNWRMHRVTEPDSGDWRDE